MQAVIETIPLEALNRLGLTHWYARHAFVHQRRCKAYRRYTADTGAEKLLPDAPPGSVHIALVEDFTCLDIFPDFFRNVAFCIKYDHLPARLDRYLIERSQNFCRFCS